MGAKDDVSSMVEQVLTHPTISQESMTSKGSISSTFFKSLQTMFGKRTKHLDFNRDKDVMLVMMVQSSFFEEQIDVLAKAIEMLAKCDQEQHTLLTKLLNKLEKKSTSGMSNFLGFMLELAKQATPQEIFETSTKSEISSNDIQFFADGFIHAK
ncbi:hypothetical protein ACSBR1_008789 [Camellia fascicularis]